MASKNGDTVFDLVRDSYHRSVVEVGDSHAVTIPKEIMEEKSIQKGDDVVIREDGQVLQIHFEA